MDPRQIASRGGSVPECLRKPPLPPLNPSMGVFRLPSEGQAGLSYLYGTHSKLNSSIKFHEYIPCSFKDVLKNGLGNFSFFCLGLVSIQVHCLGNLFRNNIKKNPSSFCVIDFFAS